MGAGVVVAVVLAIVVVAAVAFYLRKRYQSPVEAATVEWKAEAIIEAASGVLKALTEEIQGTSVADTDLANFSIRVSPQNLPATKSGFTQAQASSPFLGGVCSPRMNRSRRSATSAAPPRRASYSGNMSISMTAFSPRGKRSGIAAANTASPLEAENLFRKRVRSALRSTALGLIKALAEAHAKPVLSSSMRWRRGSLIMSMNMPLMPGLPSLNEDRAAKQRHGQVASMVAQAGRQAGIEEAVLDDRAWMPTVDREREVRGESDKEVDGDRDVSGRSDFLVEVLALWFVAVISEDDKALETVDSSSCIEVLSTLGHEELASAAVEDETRKNVSGASSPARSLSPARAPTDPQDDSKEPDDRGEDKAEGMLAFPAFLRAARRLQGCAALDDIFEQYCDEDSHLLGREGLAEFLSGRQGLPSESSHNAAKALLRLRREQAGSSQCVVPFENGFAFTVSGFADWLLSSACQMTGLLQSDMVYSIYHDMTLPMTEYVIASSHNTYLEGHQLYGKSSASIYHEVLNKGCRCVEIDCWDGRGGEPRVTHGGTMCTSVSFREVIQAINGAAFSASPYPVILSLEMHCNEDQQRKIAEYMRTIFGSALAILPEGGIDAKSFTPENLKRRILVKGKAIFARGAISSPLNQSPHVYPTEDPDLNSDDGRSPRPDFSSRCGSNLSTSPRPTPPMAPAEMLAAASPGSPFDPPLPPAAIIAAVIGVSHNGPAGPASRHADPEDFPDQPPSIRGKRGRQMDDMFGRKDSALECHREPSTDDVEGAAEAHAFQAAKMKAAHTNAKVAIELDRVIYLPQVKVRDPGKHNEAVSLNHICSFSEERIDQIWKEGSASRKAMAQLGRRMMLRVYPKGWRFTSSNYDPRSAWAMGAQCIALNYQKADCPEMRTNDAVFMDNGTCGYLLKPTAPSLPPKYNAPLNLSVKLLAVHGKGHAVSGQMMHLVLSVRSVDFTEVRQQTATGVLAAPLCTFVSATAADSAAASTP
eukprot:Hpha_TRINITY_DN14023_c0_g1::TRINITY_DN14023_c0_g1_i1::g.44243::m.44243/K19006/PLCH; phosphatidylinositol phospholipase C, eta